MNEIIISITESSDKEGYIYDIYPSKDDYINSNSLDGGMCTGTIVDAIEMASLQAQDIINAFNSKK